MLSELVFGCDPSLKPCFSPPPPCHTLGPEVICQSQFQRPFLSFWFAQRVSPDHHDCYFLRAYYASGHGMPSTFHEWSDLILPLSPKRKSFSFNSPSSLWVNRGWEFAQPRQLVNNWAWYKFSPFLPESQSSHLLHFSAFHSAGKKNRSWQLICQLLIEAYHVLGPILGTEGPSVNKIQIHGLMELKF